MKKHLTLIMLLACLLNVRILQAQPAGWPYIKAFTITENSGADLYQHQVRLEVNTLVLVAAGQMDISGADIRFGKDCQGLTNYNYWIESGMNTASTVIWVQIDTLFAGEDRNIFMYYGNAVAMAATTLSIFNGPNSATDSVVVGSAGGVTLSQRGFRFAPTEDILITSFGKYEPTGTDRYVTLFKYSSQSVVDQATVSGPAATYDYASLTDPFWIQTDTQYILSLYQGATDGYYFGSSTQIGQHLVYYDMRYCNGCTENTFPDQSLANIHYGFPDLHYYTRRHASPEPTAAVATNNLDIMASSYMICSGDSVQLHVSVFNGPGGPYTYLWSPSVYLDDPTIHDPTAFVTTDTAFEIMVGDQYLCYDIITVDVTLMALPTASINNLDTFMCIYYPAISLNGTPSGGVFSGIGVSGNSFDPSVAGIGVHEVYYTVTNAVDCIGIDTATVTISMCSGIAEEENPQGITVSPNPGNGVFLVVLQEEEKVTLTVLDPMGKQILQQPSAGTQNIALDLSGMAAGVYFLQIKGESSVSTLRLVVQ